MSWRKAVVVGEVRRWAQTIEYAVDLADADATTRRWAPAGRVRALGYVEQVGQLPAGAAVLLNTSALELALGTGGAALIVAAPDHVPPAAAAPGHIVKARYTPCQQLVAAVEAQESAHHRLLADDELTVEGLPVVVADLHSSLPAITAGVRARRRGLRVVYVMTDEAALPMALSQTVAGLRAAGWLAATISVGQSYGGDVDAVTVHSALLAARHVLAAEVVIVTQGPGNVGTGTPWGFTGISVGETLNAVHLLGGEPIACLRVSFEDRRSRHVGLSHHTTTAVGRVSLTPVVAPYVDPATPTEHTVAAAVADLTAHTAGRVRGVAVARRGLAEALASSPVPLRTMGRGLDQEPETFLTAAAAGAYAADRARSAAPEGREGH